MFRKLLFKLRVVMTRVVSYDQIHSGKAKLTMIYVYQYLIYKKAKLKSIYCSYVSDKNNSDCRV